MNNEVNSYVQREFGVDLGIGTRELGKNDEASEQKLLNCHNV